MNEQIQEVIGALGRELVRVTAERDALAEAAIAYDLAILACANDPSKMATAVTATGDDLDALYERLMARARLALGVTHPVIPGETVP